MTEDRRFRLKVVALVAALALAAAVSGCGKKSDTTTTGPTALGGVSAARSALSTAAPDAKLLVVQTAQAVEATGTPVWAYLFGSPSTDKTFVVYVSNGKLMGQQEYGTAGLTAKDWANVKGTESMKVDSDDAYDKAVAASGAKGDPLAYMMGFVTFTPANDTSGIKPFVWSVQFDPGESGATTSTIQVDGETGKATVAK